MERRPLTFKSSIVLYSILFALVFFGLWGTCHDLKQQDGSHFVTVTVHKGDSLWSLGDQYKGDMSMTAFINWVEKKNELRDRNALREGQQLILPVKNRSLDTTVRVADARNN